uniref:Uncharacterized protein n=1 Tax=Amphimedon queenslandica TaxID=400682 RepID=A0A1X7UG32_AMPQE
MISSSIFSTTINGVSSTTASVLFALNTQDVIVYQLSSTVFYLQVVVIVYQQMHEIILSSFLGPIGVVIVLLAVLIIVLVSVVGCAVLAWCVRTDLKKDRSTN